VLANALALNVRHKQITPTQLTTTKSFSDETCIPTSHAENGFVCGRDDNINMTGRVELSSGNNQTAIGHRLIGIRLITRAFLGTSCRWRYAAFFCCALTLHTASNHGQVP
jgi:hypothetical protein